MANRNRPIQVKFRVTPEERVLIDKRMAQAGTINMAAYLRKMAIDGYVVKLELPELRDLISLLVKASTRTACIPLKRYCLIFVMYGLTELSRWRNE